MRVKHAVVLLMLISPLSWAGSMTFQFRNPNFGGNPNNGAFLLNSAQAQNSYKDPSYNDDFGIETPSALDNVLIFPAKICDWWPEKLSNADGVSIPVLLRPSSHKFWVGYCRILIPVNRAAW
ncbi:hypothetical protein EIMP300_62200 [Escherichia coli]|uniref:Curli production assembly/transport component CsgF n=1 Tax=Escherichia coli TaxID=562 RepID=A0A8S0FYI2_ECOLX|nr:hypothetical protein EIMP300_62200 [Escherichia coli]